MVITNLAVTQPSLSIDPRSFHVFEFRGDRLLFDRATGTTCEIDGVAYEVLRLCKSMSVDAAIDALRATYCDLDADEIRGSLLLLKKRGFFVFTPVDSSEQEEMLEALWNHKPRRIQMLMAQGCNLGCRYCYAWRNGSNQKHTLMPWNIARGS